MVGGRRTCYPEGNKRRDTRLDLRSLREKGSSFGWEGKGVAGPKPYRLQQ